MRTSKGLLLFAVAFLLLLGGCSSSPYLAVKETDPGRSVKIYFDDGSVDEVLVLRNTGKELTYVSASTHEEKTVSTKRVRKIVKIEKNFDYFGNPISQAEISKYKSNKYTWTYAIGGAVVGAAAGIAISYPFWVSGIDFIPPYFVGGVTGVASSIWFALKGQKKDQEMALEEIRYIRKKEREMEEQLEKEKERLKKIEEEKRKLKEQLEKKQGKK